MQTAIILWFALVFAFQWLAINGVLAKWIISAWKDTPLESFILPGRMAEIAFLTLVYRWFGWITLPVTVTLFLAAFIHSSRAGS